jgi:hypothetical protein
VKGIALSRDNTGALDDRAAGAHTIQFTADEFVPEDDASVESARWTAIGRATAHLSGEDPGLRRLYGFDTVEVRAIRVLTAAGNAFDEIELTAAEGLFPSRFRRGDADGSGKLDLTDAISTLQFLFMGGTPPPCKDAADTDDSGKLDLTDAISSLQYQFMGGPPPADPGPSMCGPDPTPDDEYAECTYTSC